MPKNQRPHGYWTYYRCLKAAKKCKTRTEFHDKYSGARRICILNGWMKDMCKHMIRVGNRANKCIYAYEFPDNHVYVGLTYNIQSRNTDHLSSKKRGDGRSSSPVYNHFKNTDLNPVLKQITGYIKVDRAAKLEGYWQRKYEREGWIPLHSAKPGYVGPSYIKRTKEYCAKIALEYNSRREMSKKCSSIYYHILKNKWTDELFKHFTPPIVLLKWSKERCKQCAKECSSRRKLYETYRQAYEASLRNKWLDEFYP